MFDTLYNSMIQRVHKEVVPLTVEGVTSFYLSVNISNNCRSLSPLTV